MEKLTIETGKHVIVRANEAGVFFGILKEKTDNNITLINVRKLYYWSGANTVEQLSIDGVNNPDNCKFTQIVDEILINNYCQILPCTNKSINSLNNVFIWKY